MPDFSVQNNFPMAAVIQAAQQNNALQTQARENSQKQLLDAFQTIGGVGQSLLDRKLAMSRALAQAKVYGAMNPEAMQPTTTTNTTQEPITRSQTAQGTDDQGNPLPSPVFNTGNSSSVATRPQTTTTINPPALTPAILAQAFMGEQPGNFLTNLQTQQKLGIEKKKEAFEESFAPQKLAAMTKIQEALAGLRGKSIDAATASNLRDKITSNEQTISKLVEGLPKGIVNSFIQGTIPSEQYRQTFNQWQQLRNQNETYKKQLYGGSSSGIGGDNGGGSNIIILPGVIW